MKTLEPRSKQLSGKTAAGKVKQLPHVNGSRSAKLFIEKFEIVEVRRTAGSEMDERMVLMQFRTLNPSQLAQRMKEAAKGSPVLSRIDTAKMKRAHYRHRKSGPAKRKSQKEVA